MATLIFMSKIPIVVYNSYEPWHTTAAWTGALYDRAHKMCSNVNLFQKQVARI